MSAWDQAAVELIVMARNQLEAEADLLSALAPGPLPGAPVAPCGYK